MTEAFTSGQKLLDKFFEGIEDLDRVDTATAKVVKRLYDEGKLSATNIANELSSLREAHNGSETDKD